MYTTILSGENSVVDSWRESEEGGRGKGGRREEAGGGRREEGGYEN
jgi:hypothetical protein